MSPLRRWKTFAVKQKGMIEFMKQNHMQEMEKYISAHDKVMLTDLCANFNISMSTLRRRLDKLAEQNLIVKKYGYVTSVPSKSNDMLLHSRSTLYTEEKKKIAQIAVQFIEDNDIIFIDSGSTTGLLVDYIDPGKKVTIITNNLDVVIRSMRLSNLEIYVLPGKLNRSNNSFSYLTDSNLYNGYNIGKVFMSCSGIDLAYGISHRDINERIAKTYAIQRAPHRFLMIDSQKFNQVYPLFLCSIETFGTICTNERPEEKYVEYCKSHGIRLLYE